MKKRRGKMRGVPAKQSTLPEAQAAIPAATIDPPIRTHEQYDSDCRLGINRVGKPHARGDSVTT